MLAGKWHFRIQRPEQQPEHPMSVPMMDTLKTGHRVLSPPGSTHPQTLADVSVERSYRSWNPKWEKDFRWGLNNLWHAKIRLCVCVCVSRLSVCSVFGRLFCSSVPASPAICSSFCRVQSTAKRQKNHGPLVSTTTTSLKHMHVADYWVLKHMHVADYWDLGKFTAKFLLRHSNISTFWRHLHSGRNTSHNTPHNTLYFT